MDPFGSPARNLTIAVLYMMVVMMVATASYVADGWSFGDALYMVILTIYTVGYGEVRPIDTALLRAITISTIVLGCTGMIYLTGSLVQFITVTQLERVLSPRRMQCQIDKLRNHVVICGFGRMGQMLARALKAGGAHFVVLERNPQRVALARDQNYLCLEQDATDEVSLKAAGLERARALATVLPDDAANVFITLSARNMNRSLEIIARGEAPSTESKLLHAGANKVVLPTHIGAERIAEMILYPEVTGLVGGSATTRDFESTLDTLGLRIETFVAADSGALAGRTVEAVERDAGGSFLIVQLNRQHGETVRQPSGETRIDAGDGVVVIGRGGFANLFETEAG